MMITQRNPKYYNDETAVNNFLGYSHTRNDATGTEYPKDKWENDFKLWVIGSSYCRYKKLYLLMKIHMSSLRCIINLPTM